jgi:hypothetical protein
VAAVEVQTAFPQEEQCVQAANARSAAESWAAEQVHCGSALSDCSAVLLEHDSAPAVVPVGLWADGWVPAYSAQADLVVLLEHDPVPAVVPVGLWADGWVPAYSAQADLVVLLEHDPVPAVVPVGLWVDGWVPAYSAQVDLVVLMEHGSVPVGYSGRADPREHRCSLDERSAHWPLAELRHDSPECCKVSLIVSRAQRRGH